MSSDRLLYCFSGPDSAPKTFPNIKMQFKHVVGNGPTLRNITITDFHNYELNWITEVFTISLISPEVLMLIKGFYVCIF